MSVFKLREFIEKANRIVIFTGAGISTDSGIPDFRSPDGIWNKFKPINFHDFLNSEEMRRETWRRKWNTDKAMENARPNRGHRAIQKLFSQGKCSSIITQNIDGLHQASGIPDKNVIELHGNCNYASCIECGERHELREIFETFKRDETLPRCKKCNSPYVKTATISFGQTIPKKVLNAAKIETLACDFILVLGSSLIVYPAAGFPLIARENGAKFVIINREKTKHDGYADLVINDEIGETLGDAVNVN